MKELEDDPVRAFNTLTWHLARRDHSERELRKKLSRNYTAAAVNAALEQAHAHGYLKSAAELAETWAKSLGRKRRSQSYINGHLRRHGLPAVAVDPDQELAKCRELVATKFRKAANFTRDEQAKVARFLQNRGFATAIIKRVIYEKS